MWSAIIRKIKEIIFVEGRISKNNERYYRTHAVLDSGEECVGFGKDFKVGDEVMYFFDPKHNVTKMVKKVDKSNELE